MFLKMPHMPQFNFLSPDHGTREAFNIYLNRSRIATNSRLKEEKVRKEKTLSDTFPTEDSIDST